MAEFLVSLIFSKGKARLPLIAEAVVTGDSIEDVKTQLENNDVREMKILKYGHSNLTNFKPKIRGRESDLQYFLSFAAGWHVESKDR